MCRTAERFVTPAGDGKGVAKTSKDSMKKLVAETKNVE
jgi:hypothetical protein